MTKGTFLKHWLFILALVCTSAFAQEVTPTKRLYQTLDFSDDLDFQNMDLAIARQLKAYERINLKGQIKFGTKVYPKTVLKDSILLLKTISENYQSCMKVNSKEACLQEMNKAMNDQFAIYVPVPKSSEPGYGKKLTTKFTSYYSPDLTGSRTPTERFKNAIYSKPAEQHLQNFTRVQIDYKGALQGKGYEIFYVEDSFYDLYLLHVQGGGRINIINPDGSKEISYLSYDGKNTRSFKMVYHYMMEKGYLKPGESGVPQQRKFLEENPDKEEEVFNSCPSYVYFKESKEEPVGVNSIPLTEYRSLAIDTGIYKTTGLINFIRAVKATHTTESGAAVKVPFSRFFLSQDTGGAIKGNARCDLYAGYGPQAELSAYNTNDMGEQFFLVKK